LKGPEASIPFLTLSDKSFDAVPEHPDGISAAGPLKPLAFNLATPDAMFSIKNKRLLLRT
jgi:hypothetical protein